MCRGTTGCAVRDLGGQDLANAAAGQSVRREHPDPAGQRVSETGAPRVMIVLDTSALTAVVVGESDAEAFLSLMLANAGDLQMSAGTAVETGIVVEARQGAEATKDLAILVDRLGMAVVPLDQAQAAAAVAAWRRFGKGRHPAGLTLGDCFSYALAKISSAPLLFKGTDFAQTDVVGAL